MSCFVYVCHGIRAANARLRNSLSMRGGNLKFVATIRSSAAFGGRPRLVAIAVPSAAASAVAE